VVSQSVSDGGVLLHTEGEIYFGLNAVGMRVWELLPPSCATLDELCAALTQTYPDAPADQLRRDVLDLLEQLLANGLVVGAAPAA
jgi:hypothetical protein